MKYGVIADIHSNYEALEVCLAKLEEIGVDGYIFVGDLIGYGPSPLECVQRVAAIDNLTAVMGNHDMSLFRRDFFRWFSEPAQKAVIYADSKLPPREKSFISSFARTFRGKDFSMVHGSFNDPFREYILSTEQFMSNLNKWEGGVCFIGHSHVPFAMSGREGQLPRVNVFAGEDTIINLLRDTRYMINPGSVGQPRDANSKASFGVFDDKENTFRLLRAEYDIKSVQKKIDKAGLPKILSARLVKGV
jgi:predicted phosphodiesterase